MTLDTWFQVAVLILSIAHIIAANRSACGRVCAQTRAAGGIIESALPVAIRAWLVILGLYVLGFPLLNAASVPIPWPVRTVGIAGMLACIPLSSWTYRTLGENFSSKLQIRDGHCLVDCGPYRLVRHPMYATFLLCAISTGLVSANLAVAAAGLVVAAGMLLRIRNEEAMLLAHFGDTYRNYIRRTGAVLPKIRI